MSDSKPGIRSVALQAGVSTATVSRVLNNSGQVSENTRNRVLHAVQHAGYQPNAAAKALATSRTRTIAAIVPTLEHSIFAVFLNAIEDQLAQHGYGLVIATHGFDKETEAKRCDELLHLGADGIILSGADHKRDWLNSLVVSEVPVLFTSVYQPSGPVPSYGYDNELLSSQAIDYLIGLGHKSIRVLHGPCANNDRMRLRVNGAKKAQKKNRKIDITIEETTLNVSGGSQAMRAWIDNEHLPDACLCLVDVLALGVIFESYKHHINVPEHISVMGFEDLDWAATCAPSLTTIALPAAEMGRQSATALVDHLDNAKPLKHRLFDAQIIERESTTRRK